MGYGVRCRLLVAVSLIFFFCVSSVCAQQIVAPLDIPLFLSGNFGELRHNHFHSGLDIKTGGKTGLAVRAVKSGFISRISVSPYGYGRAVYIVHPDGTTSVYGHLDHFAPEIEQAVRDSQYLKESFTVNLHFTSRQFPVKQGKTIAYSGNSGSSGGPHLHFEFRETATDKAIDPLPFFKDKINDTRPPEIRDIRLFPQPGRGIVNGSAKNQSFSFAAKKKSKKAAVPVKIEAWGDVGVGIKAYDRMNGTSNIYGVNEIQLKVDGKEVFHSVMDAFFIDDTRYLNACIDWTDWIENRSFYTKSFTEPGNFLGLNRSLGNGIITFAEEKVYRLEYMLKDVYGNTARQTFDIKGKPMPLSPHSPGGVQFRCDRDNQYTGKGLSLSIPRKNLYTDSYLNIDTVAGHSPFAPLYMLGDRLPFHSYCPVSLEITNDSYPDKTKYGLVCIYKDQKTWLGGEYRNGRIHGRIRESGNFTVEVDSVPPQIKAVNPSQWGIEKRITFKITDDLSGIASYRGVLDGAFILFEYDAKKNALFAGYDSKRMQKSGQLRLVVTDEAGNSAEFLYFLDWEIR
jgi:hypothetical protein